MRHVEFDPALLQGEQETWWRAWDADSAAATKAMHDAVREGGPPDPIARANVWANLKRWMLSNVFDNKCAYCEGVPAAFGPQDAEHWRPKSAVTDPTGSTRPKKVERNGEAHPGYWWMAFCWQNLIPACKFCNAGRGKGTKFPIAGEYAFTPDEGIDVATLDMREKPLLLHPFCGEHPEDHIQFCPDGFAAPLNESPRGKWTIIVMDLNRDELVTRRRAQMDAAVNALGLAATDILRGRTVVETMAKWTGSAAEFSRAVNDTLRSRKAVIRELFADVG